MAFSTTTDQMRGRFPAVSPSGSEVIAERAEIDLAAADTAINKCGSLLYLPAGCVPISAILDSDDLDSGTPAIAMAVGFMNSDDSDLDGAAWASSDVAKTGGVATLELSLVALRMAPANADRKVGIKVTTGAATGEAGKVGLTLLYRAA